MLKGRYETSAFVVPRTLRTRPPPMSRMLSIWCGVCRQTTPAPWAGSCSSAERGRTIQSVKAMACRLLSLPSRPELMIRRMARMWKRTSPCGPR